MGTDVYADVFIGSILTIDDLRKIYKALKELEASKIVSEDETASEDDIASEGETGEDETKSEDETAKTAKSEDDTVKTASEDDTVKTASEDDTASESSEEEFNEMDWINDAGRVLSGFYVERSDDEFFMVMSSGFADYACGSESVGLPNQLTIDSFNDVVSKLKLECEYPVINFKARISS